MKTSEILLQAKKSNNEETHKNAKAGKGLKYLLILFILSWISFLPSCAVEMRTPQPGVSIESHHGYRHHRGNRHSRNEHVDVDIHNR
jgi:hypothetical protein